MVRILSPYFVLIALAATTYASPTKRSTVAQVEADLATIQTQVTTLDTDINNFPATGGTVLQLLAIHSAAGTLSTTLQSASTDVQDVTPSPVSETDGQTILADVQAFEPTILDALSAIVAKQAAIEGIPLGGVGSIVLSDLQALNASTVAFGSALIAAAPSDLQAQAASIKSSIDAAFATAIAAYT